MSVEAETGRIIWHDLLTQDISLVKSFYADLLGWEYQIEHASDFVWRPGEADYPLIIAEGEAHGGFVNPGEGIVSRWLAYVMVKDVDDMTARAKSLGATVIRDPFDTPGVGRSAVIQDLQGGVIGLTFPTHHFPAPSGTFLQDELITDDVDSAMLFYCDLFGWEAQDIKEVGPSRYAVLDSTDHGSVVGVTNQFFEAVGCALWIPYFATDDVGIATAKAKALGASLCVDSTSTINGERKAILSDPTGAVFGLL
ncbi:MAG: VOC family protein [Cyanobacteria bacterium J06597_16]